MTRIYLRYLRNPRLTLVVQIALPRSRGRGYNAGMLETAIEAAAEAGKLLRKNFGATLNVDEVTHHDIKLEIDKQAQQLITKVILADYPDHCILGEEGVTGNANADVRWVVDPLDGTVNYFYGIPHYAVSVAAQVRRAVSWERRPRRDRVQGSRRCRSTTTRDGKRWRASCWLPKWMNCSPPRKAHPPILHGRSRFR